MSLDHLMLWLSAKGEGSWSQFRGAIERLCIEDDSEPLVSDYDSDRIATNTSDFPMYQKIRLALQHLGHVEFPLKELDLRWRVVPPVIALLPNKLNEGVLCGARSPDLLKRLRHLDGIETIRTKKPGMPQRLLIRGSPLAIASAATHLGCLIQEDAATTILTGVPNVRDSTAWFRTEIPETSGWTVHRFSSSRLRWVNMTGEDVMVIRTGFFGFVMKHQTFYYLRWHGSSYNVPVQSGKYAVMRRKHGILTYDTPTKTLSVPVICRPPLLIERALVLCSGILPHFDSVSRRVKYLNVPPDVARLAARLLRQELK